MVIVRYAPEHSPYEEWIFNQADIDTAKVVWAREMGPQAMRELLSYFKDRRLWLLKVDQTPRLLTPYPKSVPD